MCCAPATKVARVQPLSFCRSVELITAWLVTRKPRDHGLEGHKQRDFYAYDKAKSSFKKHLLVIGFLVVHVLRAAFSGISECTSRKFG